MLMSNFFGWRKASKCKKLMKRFQCRLKLLNNKRCVIAKHLREDIVQLLKNGYQHIAFKKLEELYGDENVILVYEFLDQFSNFILLHLSYISKHKDLPNDLNEAISTLIFASARCGELPELIVVRKLFQKRYGRKFTNTAVELHPGNLVNQQMKELLTLQSSVSEEAKNRLLNEIVKEFYYKPGILPLEYKQDFQVQRKKDTELHEHQEVLSLEYKPDFEAQPQKKSHEDEMQDECINQKSSTSASSCSIVLQCSPSIVETPKREKMLSLALTPCEYVTGAIEVRKVEEADDSGSSSSEDSNYCSDDSLVYQDDVQEFESPVKKGAPCDSQDQRLFLFSFSSLEDTKMARKRLRRRSLFREKPTIDDIQYEVYYGIPSNRRKCQKKVRFEEPHENCLVDHGSHKVETRDENSEGREIVLVRDYVSSPFAKNCEAIGPYTRDVTTPEMEMQTTAIARLNSTSLRHVHPKLPDYDDIAAKFTALKKIHQQNYCTQS